MSGSIFPVFDDAVCLDPHAIHIQIDGSCYRNPGGESGCAAIAFYPEHLQLPSEQIVDRGYGESTNNRMELMACLKALEWVRERQPWTEVVRVQLVTDSTYLANGIHNAPYWKKNKWRNQDGKPMFNSDLWDDLLRARMKAGLRVDVVYQKGKKTAEGKLIDAAAKAAAKRGRFAEDSGYRPGAFRRSMVKDRGAALAYPASGQEAVIRPYAKKPLLKEERVSFNVFDETKQTYESKFFAFATREIAFDLHTWRGWKVKFNDKPGYPQIERIIGEIQLPDRPPK